MNATQLLLLDSWNFIEKKYIEYIQYITTEK